MQRKIQKKYIDNGFGFDVHLFNVPMIKTHGIWSPEIDYNKLQLNVLEVVVRKPGRLSGAEIRFIRLATEMTLKEFATRLGISHVAVLKWEKSGPGPTQMNWATEKDIRLFALSNKLSSKAKVFSELYSELEEIPKARSVKIEISMDDAA